jgi:DNA-binding PucR family transcriptional regulator
VRVSERGNDRKTTPTSTRDSHGSGTSRHNLSTLRAAVENDFDRPTTAATLPLHRNTLANRIRQIERRTALDLRSMRGRGLAWLAVMGAQNDGM